VAVDTANVTFSKRINPLLQTNCVGCHKTGSVSGGVLLDSYANIKAYVDNKKMWGAMNYITGYSAMPPSQKLTDCQLSVVKKWIDKGAKND
jgi:mono/diheme cytochrome c family protein